MAFDPDELAAASAAQAAAATDPAQHVRVIAGPGTGKSFAIEKRVAWLLDQGVDADRIVAVSFTRAAADDLGTRVAHACREAGHEASIRVGTLHAFALRTLRLANRLSAYPSDPVVLQRWEVENIFDSEFGRRAGINSLPRRRLIRADHEAFWQTGYHTPPQVVPADPPITDDERTRFQSFHRPRTQLYSCVLPGEIVRLCVDQMEAGTLNPVELLNVEYLIVDEFQDLNPMDLQLVHGMADRGVRVFAAGDDDQSLYAFRFATPSGIQEFATRRADTGEHTLSHCFRCTPAVLDGAQSLIRANADVGRIEKQLTSMYATADPARPGRLGCWRFGDDRTEARAVAESCRHLIDAGMDPREIMILLSARGPAPGIHGALETAGVPFAPLRERDITDTDPGRAAYAMLAIVVDAHNYIAHRTLLGVRAGVGVGTCDDIAQAVVANHRNYRELFYDSIPAGMLTPRQQRAVEATAALCAELAEWSWDDLLGDRIDLLLEQVGDVCGGGIDDDLQTFLSEMPQGMTLAETFGFLASDRDDDRRSVLAGFAARTGQTIDVEELVPNRVRVMTMHGSKGLSATVVFIPALEEAILPGARRAPYPGQVLEAARMLYVSITRARLGCIVSYAERRFLNGATTTMTASRFAADLGRPFEPRTAGFSPEMAAAAVDAAQHL